MVVVVNRFAHLVESEEEIGDEQQSKEDAADVTCSEIEPLQLKPLESDVPGEIVNKKLQKDTGRPPYDYYAILDFECTCDDRAARGTFKHEVIEFPVVFLNARTLEVDLEFRRYVRPTEIPRLSAFCTRLTGIEQSVVNASDTLDVVLYEFHEFLRENDFVCCKADRQPDNRLFVICSDGPADLKHFLLPECKRKKIQLHSYWNRYIDIRGCFQSNLAKKPRGVVGMLSQFGLKFEGREHSGLDDARNIARIAAELLRGGHRLSF
eukprot:TRINITY_DN1052_c2_g1_i1.p1 TRINITY_DN1052_c2_g1~~TRINITY_DN1052_c2_g1_i1.p1  ORF type:complete len:265 (-),score=34.44 TRINITY_DN1052_c2_g1_i1:97-891(-)